MLFSMEGNKLAESKLCDVTCNVCHVPCVTPYITTADLLFVHTYQPEKNAGQTAIYII